MNPTPTPEATPPNEPNDDAGAPLFDALCTRLSNEAPPGGSEEWGKFNTRILKEISLFATNMERNFAQAKVINESVHMERVLQMNRANAAHAENARLRKALEDVTGKEADYVASDLDHGNFRRNKWWRAVLRARAALNP